MRLSLRSSFGLVLIAGTTLASSVARAANDSPSSVAPHALENILNAQAFEDGGVLSAPFPSKRLLPARAMNQIASATMFGAGYEARIRQSNAEISAELKAMLDAAATGGPQAACQATKSYLQAAGLPGNATVVPGSKPMDFLLSEFDAHSANRTFFYTNNDDQYYSEFRNVFFISKVDESGEELAMDDVFDTITEWDQMAISTDGSVGWFFLYDDPLAPSCEREQYTPLSLPIGPLEGDEDVRALKKCFYVEQLDSLLSPQDYLYCNFNIYRRKKISDSVYVFTAMLYDKDQGDCENPVDSQGREHEQEKINRANAYTGVYVVVEYADYFAVFNKGLQYMQETLPSQVNTNIMTKTHYEEGESLHSYVTEQLDVTVTLCSEFQ